MSSCPNDQSASIDSYKRTAKIWWNKPNSTDNSGYSLVTCDPSSGSDFLGRTKVTCTACDKSGNDVSCSFYVNVNGMFDIIIIITSKILMEQFGCYFKIIVVLKSLEVNVFFNISQY